MAATPLQLLANCMGMLWDLVIATWADKVYTYSYLDNLDVEVAIYRYIFTTQYIQSTCMIGWVYLLVYYIKLKSHQSV